MKTILLLLIAWLDLHMLVSQLIEPVLHDKLLDSHGLIQVKVKILIPHQSIKQLIEVNESVVRSDTHFEHDLLNLFLLRDSVLYIVVSFPKTVWQLLEEMTELLILFYFETVILLSSIAPTLHEDS